jgi:hypothetical protein
MQESFPHYVIYAPNNGDLVIVSSAHGPVPPLTDAIFRAPRLAASLDRLEIRTIEDLRLRRVGDEGLARVLFAPVLTQVNSDYFPFVDTHASRTLFLNTSAPQLRDLSSATWPIIEMMGGDVKRVPYPVTLAKWGAGERVKDAIRAEHARRYILGELAEPEAVDKVGPAYAAASIFKAMLVDCGGSGAPHPPWDSAVTTATLLGVYLPPEVSAATWQRIEKGTCLTRLDADRREWIALFKAVGAREAPAMAAHAEHLLAAKVDRTPVEIEYLYGAALLGRVASGDREGARGVMASYGEKVPQARREGAELRTLQTFARMSPP